MLNSIECAKGHYTEGAELIDEAVDIIRRETEGSDCPQGKVTQSIDGGTCSGMGSLLLLKIRDNYPDRIQVTFSVYPSPKLSDVVVEPYNATLSTHQLLENSDEKFVFDNEVLCSILHSVLNWVISMVMSGITASLRFSGKLIGDLRKMGVNLVPLPRLHFFLLAQSPLFTPGQGSKVKLTVQELTDQMWASRNFLANVKSEDGKYLTASCGFRGPMTRQEVDDEVAKIQQKMADDFVTWIPNNIKPVKFWVFNNQWNLIQSLSRGENYFFNNKSHRACNFGEIPEECKGEKYLDIKYQDQGSRFVKPPHSDVYGKDLRVVRGFVTNAYLLGGSLFKNIVHEYLVSFEPVLETKNVLERRSIVIGGSNKQRKINAKLLMEKFGYWAFDNHKLFSLGRPAFKQGCNDELKLNNKYKVKFIHHESYHIDRETLPMTEEEQLLNIFKKKAMRNEIIFRSSSSSM